MATHSSILACEIPWTEKPGSLESTGSLSITDSWSLPKLMSMESVMQSNHLILCHPPLVLLTSIFPSIIYVCVCVFVHRRGWRAGTT